MNLAASPDAFHDTQKLQGQMRELIGHLRADGDGGTEPRARLLFKTAADVLAGLVKAFEEYQPSDGDTERCSWPPGSFSCRDSEL